LREHLTTEARKKKLQEKRKPRTHAYPSKSKKKERRPRHNWFLGGNKKILSQNRAKDYIVEEFFINERSIVDEEAILRKAKE
jgi:hypothetical protein